MSEHLSDHPSEHLSDQLASRQPSHDDVPLLEDDETVPPRPEEEVADVARAEPDPGVEPGPGVAG